MVEKKPTSGRKDDQKMKAYLVMQYLINNTDESHLVTATVIADKMDELFGIDAERRSIYRDIHAINKAVLMLDNGITASEAEEWLEEDTDNEEKLIVYDKCRKGFYAQNRNYDINDIRLLAECIYSAKFLEKSQTEFLIDLICKNISNYQANSIKHDVLLTDRIRTNNAEVMNNIAVINEAISKELNGEKHVPEKISFKYLKYTISDIKKQVERRHGDVYIVSPYALIINDGNYYLLAYDSNKEKFLHFRVDRMKKVKPIGEKRDGENEFSNIDLKTYTQRVFSMYGGKDARVTLRFITPLLDTVIDRFGKQDVIYTKVDDKHFTVTASVEISNQFFGWVCGFGNKVKIISPSPIVEEFKQYLDKMRDIYE
jgi:predicted DNA-binding transcriptional regulator YafY